MSRRTRTIGVVGFVLALIVSACADDGADTTTTGAPQTTLSTTTTGAPQTTLSTTTTTTAATDGEFDLKATLRYPHVITVENLDPDRNTAGFPLPMLMPAYDRLIHMDNGTGQLLPGLATSWEYTDGGAVLELKLREGVKFHDGIDFNAEAVRANIERSATLPEALGDSTITAGSISEVEVVDDFTVRLHRAEGQELQFALLASKLTENVGMMISPAAFDNPDLDRNPVGAGPFKIVEFAGDRVVYERFDDYWDPDSVKIARLEILQPLDPEPQLNALISGEIDLAQLQPSQIGEAESAGLDVVIKPSLVVWQLYLNHCMEPIGNEKLRQVFLYGIDREALVEGLTFGTGVATPQSFPPDYEAFHPDYGIDRYTYDPDRARELLAEAGFPDGVDLRLELLIRDDIVALGEAVQAQMAEVGVRIELLPVEIAARGSWVAMEDHLIIGPRSRLDPLDNLHNNLDQNGSFNPCGFKNQEIQDLLNEAGALGPEDRIPLLQQISALATEQGFVHNLYAESVPWGNKCVAGFNYPNQTYVEFRGAGIKADC